MSYYKLFTHNFQSLTQGDDPFWDGSTPHEIKLEADISEKNFIEEWGIRRQGAETFIEESLWKNTKPNRLFVLGEPIIKVTNIAYKYTWTILREVQGKELYKIFQYLYAPFLMLREKLIQEIIEWRTALTRPNYNKDTVIKELKKTLEVRELKIGLKEYKKVSDLLADRVAYPAIHAEQWYSCSNSYEIFEKVRQQNWEQYREIDLLMDTWRDPDSWGEDIFEALRHWFIVKAGLMQGPSNLLTIGLRDAYKAGLHIINPVKSGALGWTMSKEEK